MKSTEPDATAILFTALLETVGLTAKEIAMFTLEPLERAEGWRQGRKMPHHIALSLVWLAKHIIEKQEKAEASRVILLLRQPPTPKDQLQKSQKLLQMTLESVSWWASEHFEKAKLYCKTRGGTFDLTKD